jgi:hypothetical protein
MQQKARNHKKEEQENYIDEFSRIDRKGGIFCSL